MPELPKGDKGIYLSLPEDLLQAVRDMADSHGRSIRGEIEHAIRRHMACPPTLISPPLPPATIDLANERKRGWKTGNKRTKGEAKSEPKGAKS